MSETIKYGNILRLYIIYGMNMVLDFDRLDPWASATFCSLPEEIQNQLVYKALGSDEEIRDIFSLLSTAKHFMDMGFSIIPGNTRLSTMRAQFKKEDPFWVVSCSLSNFMDKNSQASIEELGLAKKRALKHCLRKIKSYSGPKIVCVNIPSERCSISIEEISEQLFLSEVDDKEGRIKWPKASLAIKNPIVTGVLVSYGNPNDPENLAWKYHAFNRIDLNKVTRL